MPKRADIAGKRRFARRRLVIGLIAACGFSILAGTLAFDRLPSLIGDNAEFMILGRALAEGRGFRYINHPEERPATKYPPGFPLMLASWVTIFGDSIVSMKASVLVCYIGVVAMTLVVGRRLVDDTVGIVTSVLVASSSMILMYSHQVLSDIPYTLFSLLALFLLVARRPQRWAVFTGMAVCIWAYFVRTVGASLVLAAVIGLMLRHKRKQALLLLGGLVLVSALWTVRNYVLTGEGSRYTGVLLSANPYDPDKGMITFSGFLSRGWTNLKAYVGYLIALNLFPSIVMSAADSGGVALRTLASIAILGTAGLGGYTLRSKALLVNVYLAGYLAVYLGWPEIWRTERFMLPVAPVIGIYFFVGLRRILAYFEVRKTVVLVICIALVATNLYSLTDFVRRPRGYPVGWKNYVDCATWVRGNTPAESLVLCRKPFIFYLFSGRKTISYPFTRDAEAMRAHLADSKPDYIVLENFGGETSTTEVYLVPVLETMLESLEAVYSTGEPVNMVLRFSPQRLGSAR